MGKIFPSTFRLRLLTQSHKIFFMPPKTSSFLLGGFLIFSKLSPIVNLAERKLKDKRAVITSFGFVRTFLTVLSQLQQQSFQSTPLELEL